MVMMLMLMFLVMVMFMYMSALRAYFLFHHFLFERYRIFHNFYKLLSGKFLNRSCDNGSLFIDASKKLHRLLRLLFVHNIGTAHNNSPRILYLVIKELSEVTHIHTAFLSVYYSCIAVQYNVHLFLNALYCLNNIRKFSYAGRLDHNSVRIIFFHYFF